MTLSLCLRDCTATESMEAMDRYFKLTERGSNLVTELRAGTATFMTLCYILAGLHSALRSFAPLRAHHAHSGVFHVQ